MNDQLTAEQQRVVRKTISRIHEQGWGIAFGFVCAIGLIAATNVLIAKGGPVIGPHLGLLRWYFPGYSVTLGGSFIGGGSDVAVGVCGEWCTEDSCPEGEVCLENFCVAMCDPAGPDTCSEAFGLTCQGGLCLPELEDPPPTTAESGSMSSEEGSG